VRNYAKNHTLSRIGALEASWNTALDSCAKISKNGMACYGDFPGDREVVNYWDFGSTPLLDKSALVKN
jgi:hypothetical protein